MKFLEEKDITYEMYKSGLLRVIFYENKILGKKICDYYLTFHKPKDDFNNSYSEFVLFDSEKELEENFPKKFLNKYNYNSVYSFYSTDLTEEKFNEAKEKEYLSNFFEDIDKEYIEDFKDEIYKEYFQNDLNYIQESFNELFPTYQRANFDIGDKEIFEGNLSEIIDDYYLFISHVENVCFFNGNYHENAHIEKSKIFLEDIKYLEDDFLSLYKYLNNKKIKLSKQKNNHLLRLIFNEKKDFSKTEMEL